MTELCGVCGHGLDGHSDKPCDNTLIDGSRCKCQSGIRSDVASCRSLAFLIQQVRDLTTITLEANGLEIARDGKVVKKSGIVAP